MERERGSSLEAIVAETRATVGHLATDISEMRQEFRGDVRRLDDRILRVMLATLATAIATLVANLVT